MTARWNRALALRVAGATWFGGFVALVIAKHTIFADTWDSGDLSLHWHYWAWQAAWMALGAGMLTLIERSGRP